jgi:hypothetical protein
MIGVGIRGAGVAGELSPIGPVVSLGPTLDLIFDQNVYYEFEYDKFDPSLNLDFVNQSYGSE